MAHEYSVLIHDWISSKIKQATQNLNHPPDEHHTAQKHFYRGQLKELDHIRKHLTNQIDLDTQRYYRK